MPSSPACRGSSSYQYGLIRPEQPIERVSVPISSAVVDSRFRRLLEVQGRELGLSTFDRLILLDWEKFQPLVRAAAPDRKVECVLQKLRYLSAHEEFSPVGELPNTRCTSRPPVRILERPRVNAGRYADQFSERSRRR